MKPDEYMSLLNMSVNRFYQGRVPEAIDYAQAAIRSQADAPKAYNVLGMALAKQNHNEAALEAVRRAVELAPKDTDIRNNLGLALARLDRIPEAIDEFHEALRLNPSNAGPMRIWGRLSCIRETRRAFRNLRQRCAEPGVKICGGGLRQTRRS